jgi:hypothetical protein
MRKVIAVEYLSLDGVTEDPGPTLADDAGVEAGHDVATLVFEGKWRHGDRDVCGEQGDQRVDIAGLVCADELCHERLLGG